MDSIVGPGGIRIEGNREEEWGGEGEHSSSSRRDGYIIPMDYSRLGNLRWSRAVIRAVWLVFIGSRSGPKFGIRWWAHRSSAYDVFLEMVVESGRGGSVEHGLGWYLLGTGWFLVALNWLV